MRRALIVATFGLVGLSGCEDCPNEPLPGVCSPLSCDIKARCKFDTARSWIIPGGDPLEFAAGDSVWTVCDVEAHTDATCLTACSQRAVQLGVDLDTDPCEGVSAVEPLDVDGTCGYYQLCDPGDYPLPSQSGGSGGGSGGGSSTPGPGFYCIPDPERVGEEVEELSALSHFDGTGLDNWDWAGEIAMHPLGARYALDGIGQPFRTAWQDDSCGWWVDSDEVTEHDAICQDVCWAWLSSNLGFEEGDEEVVWTNCEHFIENTMCATGIMPGDGAGFTWQSSTGTAISSPLTCDEACCDDIDVGACYNIGTSGNVFQVADTTRALTVPFTLNANGAITKGALVGSIAYSAPVCGSGNVTCPFYLEAMELHLPATITGTWRNQAGQLKKFSGLNLEGVVAEEVMGGWRPSLGQFQLRPRSVPIQLTTHILTSGLPSTPIHQTTTNDKALKGTVASNGNVTLAGAVTLAPGIVLTLGGAVQ